MESFVSKQVSYLLSAWISGPVLDNMSLLIIRSVVEKIWLKRTDDCLEVQFGLGWIEKEKKNSLCPVGGM